MSYNNFCRCTYIVRSFFCYPLCLFVVGSEEGDVEFIENQLDYHYRQCKEEIMGRLLARQRRLEDEQRRLDAFRANYVTHVNALQDEIERLKELNLKKDRELDRLHSQQSKMVESWTIQHDHVLRHRYQSMVWSVWRRSFLDQQELKRLTAKFVHPHYRKRMLLKVISSWRSQARASKRVADEAYWRGQIQETTAQLIQDYEKNLSELRHQLAQAEDVIRYHHEDQTMVEEKLKQAFIRGVCALNREALSVFTSPGEVAEANIRSHFAQPSVGQGAFMQPSTSPASVTASGTSTQQPPPPTNPSASASPPANTATSSIHPSTQPQSSSANPSIAYGGTPSAPLPSTFVGGNTTTGSSSIGLPSQSTVRNTHPPPTVTRAPQLPYPPHSHQSSQPMTRSQPQAHSHHPHPHPHPHPQPHGYTHSRPIGGLSSSVPQPRHIPPRPYGK